jgi:putative SOS response-associated peptidase YedK
MCYDISFTVSIEKISDYFPDLVWDTQFSIDFDRGVHILGHAYGEHPIIYRNRDDQKLHVNLMEWGIIPYYIQKEKEFEKQRASMLNIRSEKILDDVKSYWFKIRNRRCLVPVSGFYEHREVKSVKNKIPYFINLKSQPLFYLPGLYSVANLVDTATGEVYKKWTFGIITRAANPLMRQIHNGEKNGNRMPLMLPAELSKKWLEDELPENEYREILHFEMPSAELDFRSVWTIRGPKSRPDEKAKNEAFEWDQVPCIQLDES